MSEIDRYLLALARRVARAYRRHTRPVAILLAGSVAHGGCDHYSDIDLLAYYDTLPADEQLAAARRQLAGRTAERPTVRVPAMIGEAFAVRGVECQIGHALAADCEAEIISIVEGLDLDGVKQKKLIGLVEGLPLHGAALIGRWQARAADYPAPLARAMVEHHLRRIFPLWYHAERLARRDAQLWARQAVVEGAAALLGVLSGLNRVYFSPVQFKRLRRHVGQFALAPADLADRLDRLLAAEPASAAAELEALVRETLALVGAHLPEADRAGLAYPPGEREQPWGLVAG